MRQAVRAIGRCAVTLERAAERCINVLLELIKQKVNYVVQEAVVVIKDIFRRYPNRCVGIFRPVAAHCEWKSHVIRYCVGVEGVVASAAYRRCAFCEVTGSEAQLASVQAWKLVNDGMFHAGTAIFLLAHRTCHGPTRVASLCTMTNLIHRSKYGGAGCNRLIKFEVHFWRCVQV